MSYVPPLSVRYAWKFQVEPLGVREVLGRFTHGHMALQSVPAQQKITIALEDLAINRREETYQRVLTFLELEDAPAMRDFFAKGLTPENATSGRWKKDISSPEFNAAYELVEKRLNNISLL